MSRTSPKARKATSAPPLKYKLTSGSTSRLRLDHLAALQQGSPSPSPTASKLKKARTMSDSPLASHSAGLKLNEGFTLRKNFNSSSSSSTGTIGSDEDDDILITPYQGQGSRSTGTSAKSSPARKSSGPSPWTAAENLVLWRFVLKRGEGKYTWQEVCKTLNRASKNTRTVSGVQQHWPKLKSKLEAVIENMSPKDDTPEGDSFSSNRRSLPLSTNGKFRMASSSRRRILPRAHVKNDSDIPMDED